MNSAVMLATSQSRGLTADVGALFRRFHHVIPMQNASRIPAGTSAPMNTSCVLMMRIAAPVMFTASVCARIIASPSRINTSDGGTTTPIVLGTQTSAALVAGVMPLWSSRGCTVRESIAALAPTEPFIGASSTPKPSPARDAFAPTGASARLAARNSVWANGS